MATTRLQGGQSTINIWAIMVFLLLNHGVRSTLQCISSHQKPQPNRPGNNDIVIPGENYDPSSSGGERSDDPYADPYFSRSGRSESGNGRTKEVVFHNCQKRLTDELYKVCDGKFHDPNPAFGGRPTSQASGRRSHVKRGHIQFVSRRVPRSLVDECCTNPCTTKHVQRYCKQENDTSNENATEPVTTSIPLEEEATTQLEDSKEPESALYYSLLHIFKFMLERAGPPSQPSSPEQIKEEPAEKDLSMPQARVQDKPFDKTHVSYSSRNHYHRFRPQQPPTSFNNYEENNRLQAFPSNANPIGAGNRGQNKASASPHRSSFVGPNSNPRKNHIHYPLHSFQGTGWEQSTERDREGLHRTVSVKNVVTSTLPPQLISLSRGTDDYIYQP